MREMPAFDLWLFLRASVDWIDHTTLDLFAYLGLHPLVLLVALGSLLVIVFSLGVSVFASAITQMDAAERGTVVPFQPVVKVTQIPITDRTAYDRLVREAEQAINASWDRAQEEQRASLARHRATSSGPEAA